MSDPRWRTSSTKEKKCEVCKKKTIGRDEAGKTICFLCWDKKRRINAP